VLPPELAELPPAAAPCWLAPAEVEPLALDCAPWPADELVLPLAEGEVPPAALLEEGDAPLLLLVDGDVLPAALGLLLPVALPEPED